MQCPTRLVLIKPTVCVDPCVHSQANILYSPVDALWKYDVNTFTNEGATVAEYFMPFPQSNAGSIRRRSELTRAVGCHSSITWTLTHNNKWCQRSLPLTREQYLICRYCKTLILHAKQKTKQAIGRICVPQACHHFVDMMMIRLKTWISVVHIHFQNLFLFKKKNLIKNA